MYDAEKLNNLLSHFYIDAWKASGQKYKVSRFENIRFSWNIYFQENNGNIINNHKEKVFCEANLSFKAAKTKTRGKGGGGVKHYHP